MDRDFKYLALNLTTMYKKVNIPKQSWNTTRAAKHMDLLREIPKETLVKILAMFSQDYMAFGYDPLDALRYVSSFA